MEKVQGVPPENPKIDTSVPHNARIWNYWLGGKDHHPVDREMGERIRSFSPRSRTTPLPTAASWNVR